MEYAQMENVNAGRVIQDLTVNTKLRSPQIFYTTS